MGTVRPRGGRGGVNESGRGMVRIYFVVSGEGVLAKIVAVNSVFMRFSIKFFPGG